MLTPALVGVPAPARARAHAAEDKLRRLQRTLDDVKQQLGLAADVTVQLVPSNPFLFSVEAPPEPDGAYVVRVEERMCELLGVDELEAALAHELGHVWVFTHFPYLQTEQLANEVAMRVVSRDALARVYGKVWQAGGTKGDLAAFLGEN